MKLESYIIQTCNILENHNWLKHLPCICYNAIIWKWGLTAENVLLKNFALKILLVRNDKTYEILKSNPFIPFYVQSIHFDCCKSINCYECVQGGFPTKTYFCYLCYNFYYFCYPSMPFSMGCRKTHPLRKKVLTKTIHLDFSCESLECMCQLNSNFAILASILNNCKCIALNLKLFLCNFRELF